ncbi:MAG: hypothetical protein H7X85_08795 [Thermoanaerobaculia bacterium]|nr:hypothetical protein [Thermoanaerobaculia bacterium]
MKHLDEEQLILLHYGETADSAAHLPGCAECRSRLESLRGLLGSLDLPVPDPGPEYGSRVWRRLALKLEAGPATRVARPRAFFPRLALVGIAAALLVAAFLAGRFWQQADKTADPISAASRERVLQLAVGDHLQRSQLVLLELVNSSPETPNSPREQERAEELVSTNRLYRQTAVQSGDTAVADVLGQLERVLVEIARSPAPLSGPEQESLRKRIEGQGLLFKVRVLGARLREQEQPPQIADPDLERKRT